MTPNEIADRVRKLVEAHTKEELCDMYRALGGGTSTPPEAMFRYDLAHYIAVMESPEV